jgi:hypothetical protein
VVYARVQAKQANPGRQKDIAIQKLSVAYQI